MRWILPRSVPANQRQTCRRIEPTRGHVFEYGIRRPKVSEISFTCKKGGACHDSQASVVAPSASIDPCFKWAKNPRRKDENSLGGTRAANVCAPRDRRDLEPGENTMQRFSIWPVDHRMDPPDPAAHHQGNFAQASRKHLKRCKGLSRRFVQLGPSGKKPHRLGGALNLRARPFT